MKDDKRKCRKVAFADENSALFTMKKIHKTSTRGVQPIRAYKCKLCNNWHLTSKPDINQVVKENEELKRKNEELEKQLQALNMKTNKEERLELKKDALVKQLKHQISLSLDKMKKVRQDKNSILHELIIVKNRLADTQSNDLFVQNVCMSYRHDFGLMSEEDRKKLIFECKEWIRAVNNNVFVFKASLPKDNP